MSNWYRDIQNRIEPISESEVPKVGNEWLEEKHPELYSAAKEIYQNTARLINDAAAKTDSDMPYKTQAILEALIEMLQAQV